MRKTRKSKNIKKSIATILMIIVGVAVAIFLSYIFEQFFINDYQIQREQLNYIRSIKGLLKSPTQWRVFVLLIIAWLIFLWIAVSDFGGTQKTEMMQVTNNIIIPRPAGQGQHGTSRFMTEREKEESFYLVKYKKGEVDKRNLGIIIAMEKKGKTENILCIEDDEHTIIIGATRSGKSRTEIIETIWLRGLAGKSMVITDPKGELYLYTNNFLKEAGIKTYALDLRQPKKSVHYNYMANVNRAVKEGDIPQAIDYTWDLVSVLVGVPKGEPLWTNGESAVIAASIMAIALEAPEEYRNLTNAYYFIAYMCKANEYGEMPITTYFEKLPDDHPAKGIFAVAEISPERTRGSFFGSALATLRLFTNWNIAAITADSEFDIRTIGNEPTALFIIVPDEKTTLYSLISLLINQIYVSLVEEANKNGGRLKVPVDFLCDEFGNCPAIPGMGSMLSAGAGRGIRFTLVLQDYQQLEKNYKDDYENIKGNCRNTIYLSTPSQKTREELSKRTGTYSCLVNSSNSSISGSGLSGHVSYGGGSNLQSRALLTPEEIGRIERPYSLVLRSGTHPAIVKAPDLSEYYANEELGLGDKEFNQKICVKREAERKERVLEKVKLWGIWNDGIEESNPEPEKEEIEPEKVSFIF